MRFIQRLGYYLGGFSIGLIILAFFLSGKKTSCAYFPEDRVLKTLKGKPYTLSNEAQQMFASLDMDSLDIKGIWEEGEVHFRESDTRKEPCGMYSISGDTRSGRTIQLEAENCPDTVHIKTLRLQ